MKHVRLFAILGIIGATLAAPGAAFADSALHSGIATTLPALPKGNYLSNYYIDVAAGARQLNVSLNANGGDVDLFVRFGTPFPLQDASVTYPTVSYDLLNRYGHYHSVSSTSNEAVTILPSGTVPLQAGRWYIALINGGTAPAAGTLTATVSDQAPVGSISLNFTSSYTDPKDAKNNCDISYWTDATPATPIGGNPGTTLGAQRKNALAYATNELVTQLGIPITISVQACGAHLGGDDNSATLAHAGATSFFYADAQYPANALARKYTWYPSTTAVRLNGSSMCGYAGGPCDGADNDEVRATFNMDFGTPGVLDGEKFYLGYDPTMKPSGDVDFITIAMHEITHGLGFLGLINDDSTLGPIGAKAGITVDTASNSASIDYTNLTEGPFDDIYDANIAMIAADKTYTPFSGYEVNGANDAARAAAMTSGPVATKTSPYAPGTFTDIRWSDPELAASPINIHSNLQAPDSFPSLYAPCDKSDSTTCDTQSGSTLSHTIQSGDMMNAFYSNSNLRNMGLAVPMLGKIGWSNANSTMPVWGQPMPNNWYDVTHNGHGFDFQLGYRDAVNGDVYFLTFYTYKTDGTPEWYHAEGHLVDGVFLPTILAANGATLVRIKYASTAPGQLNAIPDPSIDGSVVVDFNQAANAPQCRSVDRSGAMQLAVMYWTIGNESGTWCMEPIVALAQHANPDYNGHWYSSADSGWGFELLDVANAPGSPPSVYLYIYYPDATKQPTWAAASGVLNADGTTGDMPLQRISNGFCRSCTPPADLQLSDIGHMSITLNPIVAGQTPSGTASIAVTLPGTGQFVRSNVPIQMLSVKTGD